MYCLLKQRYDIDMSNITGKTCLQGPRPDTTKLQRLFHISSKFGDGNTRYAAIVAYMWSMTNVQSMVFSKTVVTIKSGFLYILFIDII